MRVWHIEWESGGFLLRAAFRTLLIPFDPSVSLCPRLLPVYMHITLIGDSTLDNAAYTAGGPHVTAILNDLLGPDGSASLAAVDGARMRDVGYQVDTVKDEATHAVLSVGGNDALLSVNALTQSVDTIADALLELEDIVDDFAGSYRRCLKQVLNLGLPTTVCTIYPGDFSEEGQQRVISAALTMWNHAITQAALDHGCPIIELGRVCDETSDYVRQIEPNEKGGRKIATAIHSAITEPDTCSVPLSPRG